MPSTTSRHIVLVAPRRGIEKTVPYGFSTDETADVGVDEGAPATEGSEAGAHADKFIGNIDQVTVESK